MNDLEDLLRSELQARADAAQDDAAAAGGPNPFARLDERIGRARLRRKLGAAAAAAAVTAAIVIPLALIAPAPAGHGLDGVTPGSGDHGGERLSDPSLTPPGWTPVSYRDAQVSVPSSWVVQPGIGSLCGVTTHGGAWLGHRTDVARLRYSGCKLPSTTVFVSAIPFRAAVATRQRMNGIPVVRQAAPDGALSEAAPTLGVEVTVLGPKAGQILATLTRSPASVVLARGPAPAVPRAWRWHTLGGIRFAVPGSWKVRRTDRWGSCRRPMLASQTLVLSTARRPACRTVPLWAGLAGDEAPSSGAAVGAGPLASRPDDYSGMSRCTRLHGLRACLAGGSGFPGTSGNPLELIIFPRGHALPTVVQIGLAGTGEVARTIMYSIGPSRS